MEAAASIIGLVAIGLKVYVTLEGFVSTCKDAPEIAKVTRDEVRDFWYALHRLRPFVERTADITPLGAAATDAAQLSLTLGSCMITFSEVEKLLDRLLPKAEMNYIGRTRWTVSGAGLTQLMKRIQQHKNTLNLLLTIWMSESSAQTEQAIDILNDLLRDLLGTKEQPTTPDSAAQLEAITSLHDPDAPITSNEAHMSFCDDNASILTTSTSLTTQSKHSLKSILLKTKLYSDPKLFESSGFSISTSRRRGTQWSQFTVGSNTSVFSLPFTDFEGSGLSIAEEGNVSQINVPVDQGLLYRPHWYPSLRPILSPLSTNDTRNQKIRRSSKDSTRPISIPPRPEFEEDSFDLFRTRDMEEVSELILSGRDPDGDLLYHVANKSAVLAELILDRACGQNLKPAVFHPLLNAAISIRYWELIDILFRRNQIPESGLIDPNWRQVMLRYAAESIHIAHALCKGPIPATFLDLAIASDASDDLAPLAFACMRRNVNMVRFLLNNGADALEIPTSGVTALHHATLPPDINITILKMLIDRGADIRSLHHENVPLLHYLITYYFRGPWEPNVHELFRFLLTAGCSSSLTDHNGTTALSHATILKDRRAVELLLDYSSPSLDLEAKDLAGDTALHKALMYHDYLFRELPSLLLRRGASVNATMSDGTTPLLLCLWHSGKQSYTNPAATSWQDTLLPSSCIPLLEMMMFRGADINARGPQGFTPLIQAIDRHDPELDPGLVRLHFLIGSGASLSITDDHGDSALIHAVRKGDLDLLRLLWMSGVDLETINKSGRNALHEALHNNLLQVVELLLERGANIEAKTEDGSSPLLFFIRHHYYNGPRPSDALCHTDEEHIQMIDALLNHGADVSRIVPRGESALYDLFQSKSILRLFQVLVDRGFSFHVEPTGKRTILLDAMMNHNYVHDKQLEVLEFVIENAPSLSVTRDHLSSALVFATTRGRLDPMRLLLDKGADPNVWSISGQTVLHIAVAYENHVAAKLLLDKFADIDAVDNKGRTPLYHAIDNYASYELIEVLASHGATITEPIRALLPSRPWLITPSLKRYFEYI